ncbi:hypothetical protein J6590_009892, partial [Homalodisca vitripennis]
MGRRKLEVGILPSIERVDVAKYLGVIIDKDLNWTSHDDSLCKKLSSGLYVTAKTAYYALFEAHLR